MQIAVITAGLIVALMFGILLYLNRVEVSEPNVGVVYLFGLIIKRIVPGRVHFYIRKIGNFKIFRIVILPGRYITIHIVPENAYSRNIKVNIDIEIILRLKPGIDGFPTLRACRNLLRLVQVGLEETLFGQFINGVYQPGVLDRFFNPIVSGAVSRVIPEYDPENITDNQEAVESLTREILEVISPFIESWADDIYIKIQDLHSVDASMREKMRRDALAEAESRKTIQLTEIDITEEYRKRLGDKYATIYATTNALKGANVNLFGAGFGDAVGSLLTQKLQKKQNARRPKSKKGPQQWDL